MSAIFPVIEEWDRLGLEWVYITQAKYGALTLPPTSETRLPIAEFTFNYPEGVLLNFTTYFDHPDCGIRISSGPEYDTEEEFTVSNIAQGLSSPEWQVYALVPPATLPGVFGLRLIQPHLFIDWLRLSVINPSNTAHRSTSQKYQIAVLTSKRLQLNLEDVETAMLLLELYPEIKVPFKAEMREALRQWLRKKDLSTYLPME